jgi:hypothetical protein
MQKNNTAELKNKLINELRDRHGEVVGGDALRLLLGYPSLAAFKQAVMRKTLMLPTFFIEGRRGRFALTIDIADWLANTKVRGIANNGQWTMSNLPSD